MVNLTEDVILYGNFSLFNGSNFYIIYKKDINCVTLFKPLISQNEVMIASCGLELVQEISLNTIQISNNQKYTKITNIIDEIVIPIKQISNIVETYNEAVCLYKRINKLDKLIL